MTADEASRAAAEPSLAGIEEILEAARNGRMSILVDDESRENEGDLVIPAQMATPEAINFMAKHGRGLICLSLTRERIEQLDLPPMSQANASRQETAFTVSIEAQEGVTTGISAADRAHTIQTAIDPLQGAEAITSPGHVFPLMARDGGVLVRAGHTEASVDIARLAGLNPSAVICEVMNEDGTMARRPDLMAFAERHGIKVGTIRDLIAYRLRHDSLVECVQERPLNSVYGDDWTAKAYVNTAEYEEHLVLVKGDVAAGGPPLVRMHALDIFDDIVGERSGRVGQLQKAMEMIGEAGRGVVVIIRDVRPDRLTQAMTAREQPSPPVSGQNGKGGSHPLREYGIGAQILLDLGVKEMILLSNTRHKIIGLEGYGLNIVDQKPIPTEG